MDFELAPLDPRADRGKDFDAAPRPPCSPFPTVVEIDDESSAASWGGGLRAGIMMGASAVVGPAGRLKIDQVGSAKPLPVAVGPMPSDSRAWEPVMFTRMAQSSTIGSVTPILVSSKPGRKKSRR